MIQKRCVLILNKFCLPFKKNSGTPPANLNAQIHTERTLSDGVVAILEWMLSNSLGRYQELLLPNISVSVVPNPEADIMFIGNTTIQLTLSYNTLYYVSVTQPGICGQPNQTVLIEKNYGKQI